MIFKKCKPCLLNMFDLKFIPSHVLMLEMLCLKMANLLSALLNLFPEPKKEISWNFTCIIIFQNLIIFPHQRIISKFINLICLINKKKLNTKKNKDQLLMIRKGNYWFLLKALRMILIGRLKLKGIRILINLDILNPKIETIQIKN